MDQNPDLSLGVEFYTRPIHNKLKSDEAGRPIYDDVEYVKIAFPGDNKRQLEAPASEMHYNSHMGRQVTYAERFSEVYKSFKEGNKGLMHGTPVSLVPGVTPAIAEEMKAINVLTAEHLAGLTKSGAGKLGPQGLNLVEQAKKYLNTASSNAEVDALRAELAALKAQVAPQAEPEDAFAAFSDDDLRNMISDAGFDTPHGNVRRDKLIEKIEEIRKEKEAA